MNVVSQLISVSQQIEAEWLETNIVVAHQFLYIAVAELTEGRGGGQLLRSQQASERKTG